jgi:hypothetical protein
MNIEALRALISQPPYDTMTDAELQAALNAPTEIVQQPISKGRLIQWAGGNKGFTTMERASVFTGTGSADLDETIQNIGKAALTMFNGGDVAEFDTASPENVQMITLLVSVGLMTQQAADSLMQTGQVLMTPADAAGIGYVNYGDIAEARAV